jgi:hypothetical protein
MLRIEQVIAVLVVNLEIRNMHCMGKLGFLRIKNSNFNSQIKIEYFEMKAYFGEHFKKEGYGSRYDASVFIMVWSTCDCKCFTTSGLE